MVVVHNPWLDQSVGHLAAKLVETVELLRGNPHVRQIETLIE